MKIKDLLFNSLAANKLATKKSPDHPKLEKSLPKQISSQRLKKLTSQE
ncbi:hypothetical protein MUN89_15875 [Halobacillus salinarum]|uniref:Uncharacterized protein n=1 Tax=Halobacillus salinarum TaxID=2932257 RepID=A0ABY4EG08_9BACI|nr:hypothetical protein [Halobacillus salinarum]UOQ43387.1 hypothetical protein MUN89_15875 [Halobacillus salinarum]